MLLVLLVSVRPVDGCACHNGPCAQDVGPKLCTPTVIGKLKDQMFVNSKDHPVQSTCALTILGLSEHQDKHSELVQSGVVPLLVDSLKVWRLECPLCAESTQ